jgi:hypothetical protein
MRGVCMVGFTFAYMAYRNFIATLQTLLEKSKKLPRKGRSAGGGRGNGGSPSDETKDVKSQ